MLTAACICNGQGPFMRQLRVICSGKSLQLQAGF